MTFLGIDKYDLGARLRPALFTLLPPLLIVAVWFRDVWTFFGTIVALFTTCGLTYLFARLARFLGKNIERDLVNKKGGLPTTVFLRHRDGFLPFPTKQRYHDALRANGLTIPTASQEESNSLEADEYYRSAVQWLLERTRGPKFSMLLGENIDYGFRRNLLGLKPFGLMFAILALFANVFLLYRSYGVWDVTVKAGWASLIALLLISLVWIFKINIRWVEDASENYAERLLAQLETLVQPKTRRRK